MSWSLQGIGRRALGLAPDRLFERLRLAVVYARVTQDRQSLARYRELSASGGDPGEVGAPVELRLRPLSGRKILARPRTSDADTIWDAFVRRYHLPPAGGVPEGATRIWDLGSNIGLTLADMAVRFPDARIVGVELDPGNAVLARHNIAPWANRCELIQAAVWPVEGEVSYKGWSGNTSSFRVGDEPDDIAHRQSARALTLNSLAWTHAEGGAIDYVKMDIEGAERAVLTQATEWAQRVRCIQVEVHEPYGVAECMGDLRALGFDARPDRRHRASVIGMRSLRGA